MISSITDGISEALHGEFEECRIYTEEIEQELKEPCFFIQCTKYTNELYRGRRYERNATFCIQYFPQTADVNAECAEVTERLFNALEIISFGDDKQRGTQMSASVTGGVLYFYVSYDFFVVREEETYMMETLDFTPHAKE